MLRNSTLTASIHCVDTKYYPIAVLLHFFQIQLEYPHDGILLAHIASTYAELCTVYIRHYTERPCHFTLQLPFSEMAGYSIGDRVEVRWKANLFDAKVIEVHSTGKVDVVYAIASSTAPLNTAQRARASTTTFTNCTTAAAARGRCCKHGGARRKVRKEEGCTATAKARGVCAKHGANGLCKFEGCTSNTHSHRSPHCSKDGGGNKKPCSVAGCTTTSAREGLCAKHGGHRDECVFGGCTNQRVGTKWHTCTTHGGRGYCAYSLECLTPALKWGGNCTKHTRSRSRK